MQVKSQEQMAQGILEEFLEQELGDYCFKWKIALEDESENYYCYNVIYWISYDFNEKTAHCLNMRVNPSKEFENIEIQMGYNWEVVETFNWRIKYFWMNIKWE